MRGDPGCLHGECMAHLMCSVAYTAAALSAARLSGKWAALARHLLASLKRQFQDSSNQRKVFAAACDSLLLPVCRFACPGEQPFASFPPSGRLLHILVTVCWQAARQPAPRLLPACK